jgi:hypothetical protein
MALDLFAGTPPTPRAMVLRITPTLLLPAIFVVSLYQSARAQVFGSDQVLALEAQVSDYAPFLLDRLATIRDAFGTATAIEAANEIIMASNGLLLSMDELFQIRKRQDHADMAFVYAVTALAIDPAAGALVLPGAIAGKDVTPPYYSTLQRIRDRSQQLARSDKPWRQAALVERIRADLAEFEQALGL